MDNSYEFRCPQYVDFSSGLEGPTNQEQFFGFQAKKGFFAESKFTERPSSRTMILRSTPMNKPPHQTNTTDSEKINTRTKKIFKRLSKSVDCISKQPPVKQDHDFFPVMCRKRSISATAGSGRPKKLTRAITPECLKRSLQNCRKQKTTEELELEKIAELRKQTSKQLRANEVAMRKLRLKQGCAVVKSGSKDAEKILQNENYSFMQKLFRGRILGCVKFEYKYQCFTNKHSSNFQVQNVKEKQANLAGPNKAFLSERNKAYGVLKSTGTLNAQPFSANIKQENYLQVPTLEFIRRPPKSRRCLFQ